MQTKASTMKPVARAAALVLAVVALAPAYAIEDYAMWDNFDGATQIAPTKWLGFERHRMIEGGALRMIQRDLGSQSSDAGVFNNSWDLSPRNPSLIKQMKAVVTVNAFDIAGCSANPTSSAVQALLAGAFFNAGPAVPTSRTNDVIASVALLRESNSLDAAGLLRVKGHVARCTSDCNSFVILGSVDLGTATIGEAVTLRMDWDQANKRFNFYRGSDPVKRVTYADSDSLVPYLAFRSIGTRTNMANCLTGARTEGFMDAKFDKVSVNASAAP